MSMCEARSASPDRPTDVLKAARVRFSFEHHDKLGKGSYALDGMMIDAPVYKQVSTSTVDHNDPMIAPSDEILLGKRGATLMGWRPACTII